MNKNNVLALIQDLPEEGPVDIERLIYTLFLLGKIERGAAQADAGDTISHEEFVQEIETWPELLGPETREATSG